MCLLFETIKVCNKKFFNIEYHNARVNNSRKDLFNDEKKIDLKKSIILPKEIGNGLYKCRVIYSNDIESVEYIPYTKKKIRTIKLIECNSIDYKYKFVDRKIFDELLKQNNADEIIIVKNGYVTDTSYSNLVFYDGSEWFTPTKPLLNGTKREKLLYEKLIFEREIKIEDLIKYEKVSLINAMLDLGEVELKVESNLS